MNFLLHTGLLNKNFLGPFGPVRPAGLDFQARPGPARPGPRAARPVAISNIYIYIQYYQSGNNQQVAQIKQVNRKKVINRRLHCKVNAIGTISHVVCVSYEGHVDLLT